MRLGFKEQAKFKEIYAEIAKFEENLQKLESQFILEKENLQAKIQNETNEHKLNKKKSLMYKIKTLFNLAPLGKSITHATNTLKSLEQEFQSQK